MVTAPPESVLRTDNEYVPAARTDRSSGKENEPAVAVVVACALPKVAVTSSGPTRSDDVLPLIVTEPYKNAPSRGAVNDSTGLPTTIVNSVAPVLVLSRVGAALAGSACTRSVTVVLSVL